MDQHEAWGLRIDGHMQTARTSVARGVDPPPGPCLHAFCYAEKGEGRPTFVISGAPEPPGTQTGLWDAMGRIMDERLTSLGVSWKDVNNIQFYGPVSAHTEFAAATHLGQDVTWFFSRPPVEGLQLELDVRGLARDTFV